MLRLLAATAVVPLLLVLAAPAAGLEQRLIASDGAANHLMGISSAVEGDTAVIGAPGADGSEGAVYVFTRVGDAWAQSAKLTALIGAAGDRLGGSVAIDGDTIVAGARDDDIAGDGDRGSVTHCALRAAVRNETAKLTASDGDVDDRLGSSVAIDGDTIVGGAPGDAISGEDNRARPTPSRAPVRPPAPKPPSCGPPTAPRTTAWALAGRRGRHDCGRRPR